MDRKLIKLKDGIKNMSIEEVYEQFKNYIYKTCQSWCGQYELDDLHQIAFIGLKKAYDTYDIKNGTLFLTYAAFIIGNEIRMFHRKNKKYRSDISIDSSVSDSNDTLKLEDMIPDDKNYEDEAITNIEKEELKIAISNLRPIDKKVVNSIAFDNATQEKLAESLGLSQSYVSRIYKNALVKLRKSIEGGTCMEKKITREQLLAEVREHGTNSEATKIIAKKYGLKPGTVRNYYDKMDVRKESRDYRGNISKEELTNDIEKQDKTNLKEPILKAITIYKGAFGEYEITGNLIELRIEDNSLTVEKANINSLIIELQELNKIIS